MTKKILRLLQASIALSSLGASMAQAEAPAEQGAAAIAVSAPSPFGEAGAVDTTELARIAGQANVNQTVQAQNSSTVSGNTVSGQSVTGGIAFDAQSFQGMNGLSVLSANTGNNVAINSSLNVNVAVHP